LYHRLYMCEVDSRLLFLILEDHEFFWEAQIVVQSAVTIILLLFNYFKNSNVTNQFLCIFIFKHLLDFMKLAKLF
jgi:hypothetical protein